MNVSDLFTQINAAYRGTDDDAPTAGTTDYALWLTTTNRKKHEWATDAKNEWESLFDGARTIGTVTVGTQSYDLDDDFMGPSDEIIVTTTSGQDIKYAIVKPSERGSVYRSVYVSGRDPQTLTFYDVILSSDQIVGGAIRVPGYYEPDDLAKAVDTVPVDDPYWLVYAVASELAFNDITYQDKVPDLNAKANARWNNMVSKNQKGTNNNPRKVRTNVARILGPNRRGR